MTVSRRRGGEASVQPDDGVADAPGGAGDRGISFPLAHAMTVAITAVVVSALVVSAGGLLSAEREGAAGRELAAIGGALAADVAAVDRLVDGPDESASLRTDYPDEVLGAGYVVSLSAPCRDGDRAVACLTLAAAEPRVERTIGFHNETPVENSSASGGSLVVGATNGSIALDARP